MFTWFQSQNRAFLEKTGESRLVFVNVAEENKLALQQLERDIEALEEKLATTMGLEERARIREEMEGLQKERADLTHLAKERLPSPADSVLLYGLGNHLANLDQKLEGEKVMAKRRDIMQRKMKCLDALEKRRKPVTSDGELREALLQVQQDNFLIRNLDSENFDYLHVEFLLDYDINAFFDDQFLGRLKVMQQDMVTDDLVHDTLRAERPAVVEEANEEWITYKKGVEEEIARLQEEKGQLTGSDKKEDEKRLAWIEGYLPHLTRQLEERSDHFHRSLLRLEHEKKKKLVDDVPRDLKDKTKKLLIEARAMRLEQVQAYLRTRAIKLRAIFEGKNALFDDENRKEMAEFLQLLETWLEKPLEVIGKELKHDRDPKKDPAIEAAKDLNARLDSAEKNLEQSVTDVDYIQSHYDEILKAAKGRLADIKYQLEAFTPARLSALIEERRKEEVRRLAEAGTPPAQQDLVSLKKGSAIFRGDIKALEDLAELASPKGTLHSQVNEFERRLEGEEKLDATELEAIQKELNVLQGKIGLFENFGEKIDEALDPDRLSDAKRARKVIQELAGERDIKKIKAILRANFNEQQVEFVNNHHFENYTGNDGVVRNLKTFTSGAMVFRQIGAEWKIIVNEEALDKSKNGLVFGEQIRHELLHLELEGTPALKKHWVDLFTQNKKWDEIKTEFVRAFPHKAPPGTIVAKEAYAPEDWPDDAVVSELYAMELGKEKRRAAGGPIDELNNLIFSAGIAAGALGTAGKGKPEEKYLGFDRNTDQAAVSHALGQAGHGESHEEGEGAKLEAGKIKGSADQYADQIQERAREIKEILHSEYLGYIPGLRSLLNDMDSFNEGTARLNKEFAKTGNNFLNDLIDQRLKRIKEDLSDISGKLSEIGDKISNLTLNPFRRIWINTTFLSISDLIQTGKDVAEFFQRRHKRKKEGHAAKLGETLFAGTDLGLEALARHHKAEHAEVDEWEGRLKHEDAWELYHIIHRLAESPDPSPDQLKAILRILAQKGRIDWRDKGLWKVLNKLQSNVHLTPDDPVLLHNPTLLRAKLHSAIGAIWDYDEYPKLEKENEDAYEGNVKKFIPSLDRIQKQLTERMEQLLRQHRAYKNGENETPVNPHEFEACIVYAIEKGKSYGEAALFFMIAGMVEGLLTPDRGMALDKYLNQWPATQWIYDKDPPLNREDYQRVCQKYFAEEYKNGKINSGHSGFKNFYWTVVQNDPMTLERVLKGVSERGWDHDWSRHIGALGDAQMAKRFIQGKSGQEEAKVTGIANAYVGALQWLEENAKVAEKIDFRKHFSRQIAWVAMSDAILENVAYRKTSGAPFTRWGSIPSHVAREAAVGNHGSWTTAEHQKKMQAFLNTFDQPFFDMLHDEVGAQDDEAHTARIREHLKQRYASHTTEWNKLATLEDVFNKLDMIISVITSKQYVSDQQFLTRIKSLTHDIAMPGGGGHH